MLVSVATSSKLSQGCLSKGKVSSASFILLIDGSTGVTKGREFSLSSPAPTLRLWVRFPLRHGCLCMFCMRFIESELNLLVKKKA
jgi:hypothetical protein